MPKRRKFSGESLCKLLEENGFVPVRQRGSHRILQKILPTGTITLPVPPAFTFLPATFYSLLLLMMPMVLAENPTSPT